MSAAKIAPVSVQARRPKTAIDEELLEGESLQRFDDLLVVDESRHDDAEDDRQDTGDDPDPEERIPPARAASSPASTRRAAACGPGQAETLTTLMVRGAAVLESVP